MQPPRSMSNSFTANPLACVNHIFFFLPPFTHLSFCVLQLHMLTVSYWWNVAFSLCQELHSEKLAEPGVNNSAGEQTMVLSNAGENSAADDKSDGSQGEDAENEKKYLEKRRQLHFSSLTCTIVLFCHNVIEMKLSPERPWWKERLIFYPLVLYGNVTCTLFFHVQVQILEIRPAIGSFLNILCIIFLFFCFPIFNPKPPIFPMFLSWWIRNDRRIWLPFDDWQCSDMWPSITKPDRIQIPNQLDILIKRVSRWWWNKTFTGFWDFSLFWHCSISSSAPECTQHEKWIKD